MKRCAIYTRVSTKDQTVENQLLVLKEVAKLKGYEVVREYNDEGISIKEYGKNLDDEELPDIVDELESEDLFE